MTLYCVACLILHCIMKMTALFWNPIASPFTLPWALTTCFFLIPLLLFLFPYTLPSWIPWLLPLWLLYRLLKGF